MDEFALIRRFFDRGAAGDALLGIGDDCALLAPPDALAVTTDMLVGGRHFFDEARPRVIGHKSLAVNLSDLAAMGAEPLAFTLALALPAADAAWLTEFSAGLFELADRHRCALIGGDTTRGPLNICITAFGHVPREQALRRDRARAGDDLWVSGELGAAAHAVAERQAGRVAADAAAARLDWPVPRIELGVALRALAHAAIDVSDGLLGDVGHVLERSSAAAGEVLGAEIDGPAVPVDAALAALPEPMRLALALAGGDDYELAFTAPPASRARLDAIAADLGIRISRIGRIDREPGLRVVDRDGRRLPVNARSFDHFR
ncbi:MAG TPA: thiamine-phosphate kinase [Burkholderiaceae bacterium]|nr:thiamine-phosphate kinase [Burkholderiaceae bacterium]